MKMKYVDEQNNLQFTRIMKYTTTANHELLKVTNKIMSQSYQQFTLGHFTQCI